MPTRRELLTAGSFAVSGALVDANHLHAQTQKETSQSKTAIASALSVLHRQLGDRANDFDLQLLASDHGQSTYVVSARGGRVSVRGSNAIALCRGAYAYLRETGLGMVCWSGSRLSLPARLPDLSERKVVSPYRFVQYFNVCTFGYTMPFWDWARWERELDWMALHGINMPLAMEGQEAIWQRVWKSFGITQAELDRYFTGPAYLPWNRMGNIDYFEGPLPQRWIDEKRKLQRKILDRMRELGMHPVVPAFAGFVPEAFKRIHPKATVFTELWSPEMPRQSKSLILHPGEADLYREIGARFIHEYQREFGPTEYYLADTFNELNVPVGSRPEEDLARFSRTIYNSILAGDPNGKWVMQGWLFHNDSAFWDNRKIAAFLSGVPDDRMIILDYSNDTGAGEKHADPLARNMWKAHNAFFGKQWLNGMIHTFGGNNNVKGNLEFIAAQPAKVLQSPDKGNLAGWGMDPEGTESNEVVYELMTDVGWEAGAIDIDRWIPAYCQARYGAVPPAITEAWRLLRESAYSRHMKWNSHHAWQARPSLEPASLGVDDTPAFHQAVESFLAGADSLQSNVLFRNDLIEFVAQSVGGRVDAELIKVCAAHKSGQLELRDQCADRALNMLLRIDALMNLRPDRRLETWINDAEGWAAGDDEKAYYNRDCRRLITYWGWSGLNDYAARVWSGLIRDYYVGRWREFFQALRSKQTPALDVWEESWLLAPYVPSQPLPVADLIAEARKMIDESKRWGA